jgi:hypothetical protein
MQHLDPETLALLALGEAVDTPADRAHLDECPECGRELLSLESVARVGRGSFSADATAPAAGELSVPSARVWSSIVSELGLTDVTPPIEADGGSKPHAPRLAPVIPMRSRVVRRVAAAAAAIALIAAGGLAWQLLRPDAPELLATATLDAFPDWPTARGEATVRIGDDGERLVTVTIEAPDDGGYREAWLITGDASALVSLGVVRDSTTTFTVPDDIDLDRYDLVDVSAEADDGDPAHSGDSIVRGKLQSAS